MDDQLPTHSGWERELVTKLAMMNIKEQRAQRRWSLFFKLLWLALAALLVSFWLGLIGGAPKDTIGRHTALVKLEGEIAEKSVASAENINAALKAAFSASDSVGVILQINSPGGSPVQSQRIYDEIKRLRKDNPEKPLYVVIDELCASGGYFVAAAGDKIYADNASLIGSIGVVFQGVGVDKLMEKIGVENRTVTAGENKAFMDPFAPMKPEHKSHLEAMLGEVHQQFIQAVKTGRGDRLKTATPGLFSGLIFTGSKAIQHGLIDAVGSVQSVARDVVKAEDLVDYTIEESALDKFTRRLGAQFGAGLMQSMGKVGWK
jgi:protease IV